MINYEGRQIIKVLIADDDERIMRCYQQAFAEDDTTESMRALDELSAELFEPDLDADLSPKFSLATCNQGQDAVSLAEEAVAAGEPFDVIILDVRMPPGISGVDAGRKIRLFDPNAQIVFVSGYSDMSLDEMRRIIPPASKLHFVAKPLSFTKLADDVIAMFADS